MHRCSSSQGNMVGPCSCGLFHHHQRSQSNSSSFSMLFSMPNSHKPFDHHHHHQYQYNYEPDHHHHHHQLYTSSSVDCTLSLGTPSTRLCSEVDVVDNKRRSDSYVSNFCWDLLQSKHSSSSSSSSSSPSQTTSHKNGNGRGGNSTSGNNNNSDSLLARRCANCDTTSTPLWRNGPRGPKSLCNACGIRFKKEERRASAAAAAANGAGSGVVMEPSPVFSGNQYHNNNYPWTNLSQSQTTQKMPYLSPANEFSFMDDQYDDYQHDSDNTGMSFLSWRLNVTDRPSLVHDFTR